jgi:hypothetical protein
MPFRLTGLRLAQDIDPCVGDAGQARRLPGPITRSSPNSANFSPVPERYTLPIRLE